MGAVVNLFADKICVNLPFYSPLFADWISTLDSWASCQGVKAAPGNTNYRKASEHPPVSSQGFPPRFFRPADGYQEYQMCFDLAPFEGRGAKEYFGNLLMVYGYPNFFHGGWH